MPVIPRFNKDLDYFQDVSDVNSRVTILENNEYKVLYWASVNTGTGTVSIPTGATVVLADFPSGINAITETIIGGKPSGYSAKDSGGNVVNVSTFDTSGNYTLSATPTAYPIAILYILQIKAKDWGNLNLNNVIAAEVIYDPTGTGVSSVGLALPSSIFDITGSPVTSSGTLTGTFKSFAQNLVFASPTSGSGVPTMRALVASDLPDISGSYVPLSGTVTGNPITGDIIISTFIGLKENGLDLINELTFDNDEGVNITSKNTNNPSFFGRISVRAGNININSNEPTFTGLVYFSDFSANFTDNSLPNRLYNDQRYSPIPIVVSGNTTAENNTKYINVSNATYTDPTPVEGKGYEVFVRNGTATIGGVGYSNAGSIITRVFHSGSWANYYQSPFNDATSSIQTQLNNKQNALGYTPLNQVGGDLTGTGGNGFIGYISQSSNPSNPASGFRLFADNTGRFSWIGTNGFVRTLDMTSITASRLYTFPDASGTIPLGTGASNRVSYWSGDNTLTSSANFIFDGTSITAQRNGLAATTNEVLRLTNTTAATSGVPSQVSPSLTFAGTYWNTTSLQSLESLASINYVPTGTTSNAGNLVFNVVASQRAFLNNAGDFVAAARLMIGSTSGTSLGATVLGFAGVGTVQSSGWNTALNIGQPANSGVVTSATSPVSIYTSNLTNASSTSRTGAINITTGTNAGSGGRGFLNIDTGGISLNPSYVSAGTTGNRTSNTLSGNIRIAAGSTSATLTNSLIGSNTRVLTAIVTNDLTAFSCRASPSGTTCVFTLNAACTAETEIYWELRN